ncbi:MAG: acyltransferase family protein [Atopobiaceae bacterium]|nr:acyltransferase family protein [Atopobiaceae bacterium]
MSGSNRTRIRSFDIAKGIGMLCIIAGHLSSREVNAVVFTFHVPLFFLISGCLYRKPSDATTALKKRATRLLVPYVMCATICCVCRGVQLVLMGDVKHSWQGIATSFVRALYGSGSPKAPGGEIASFGAIWFLLALFWALTMYDVIADKKWTTLASIALFAVGVATKKWWLPLSVQPGMCAVLFIHIGHLARKRFSESLGRGIVPHRIGAGALAVWLAILCLADRHLSMVQCSYPCIPVDILGALAGSLAVLWVSCLIDHIPHVSDGLAAYGKNSLTALCFHMFDLIVIPWETLMGPLGLAGDMWGSKRTRLYLFAFRALWSIVGVAAVCAIRWLRSRAAVRDREVSQRIRSYDIAKGIVILLVVATHQAAMDPVFRKLVFAFHMPFFFLVNAVFIAGRYDVRRTFRRSLRTLALPYVVVCLLEALLKGMVTVENTKLAVWHRLQAMVVGMSFTGTIFTEYLSVSLVWFVACLFVARNVYVVCRRLTEGCHPCVPYLVSVGLCVVGWWLGAQKLFLPWSADVALFAQVFMLVGDEVGKRGLLKKKPVTSAIVLVVAVWVALATGGFQIEMAMRKYPGFIACIAGACAGSLTVYWASARLDERGSASNDSALNDLVANLFVWLGRNSMVILAVHCLRRLWANWTCSNQSFNASYDWIANACVEILFCIAVCFVYDRAKACLRDIRRGHSSSGMALAQR